MALNWTPRPTQALPVRAIFRRFFPTRRPNALYSSLLNWRWACQVFLAACLGLVSPWGTISSLTCFSRQRRQASA